MKTNPILRHPPSTGYALLVVLLLCSVSLVVLAATMNRTATVATLNDRNNQYVINLNAAEAATERVFARMAFDFSSYGLGQVINNLDNYRVSVPKPTESSFWGNFQFSDAQGHAGRTYVNFLTNYSGPLPSQYPGLFTLSSPVYRIVSNVKTTDGRLNMTNAVQEDVLLAEVPITTYAIFYNSLLEFTSCATMTVNGRTHANGKIYVGSSSPLRFNGTVTTTATLSAPANNGNGPWTFPGNVSFSGNPNYKTNTPTVTVSINMTNTHSLIDIPPAGELVTSQQGQQRLYNQAQIVLLVSNANVTAKIQASPSAGQLPGQDPSPTILTFTNNPSSLDTNFPFLTVLWATNTFYDQREGKTILTSQIDIGKYNKWVSTNSSVLGKLPSTSGNNYPTILYVADNRTTTASQLAAVRLTNGIAPPVNGGLGFSVATPNPLYVWGHYNQTNAAYLGTTNTSSGTVPCAFMSDALTILSPNWVDSECASSASDYRTNDAANTTVNAAIITGIVPSTGTGITQFSGGVHNLPRLLEDWMTVSGGQRTLTLNTSIINLFNSTRASALFRNPGNFGLANSPYYDPPVRQFSFDLNYLNPARQPPGVPCALVPIRFNWAVPPPNTVTYNVTP